MTVSTYSDDTTRGAEVGVVTVSTYSLERMLLAIGGYLHYLYAGLDGIHV